MKKLPNEWPFHDNKTNTISRSRASDLTKASHLVNIIHTMWSVQLGDRDSLGGSTSQSQESLTYEDDGALEQTNHSCLPVAFTNQMILLLLDLLIHLR